MGTMDWNRFWCGKRCAYEYINYFFTALKNFILQGGGTIVQYLLQ